MTKKRGWWSIFGNDDDDDGEDEQLSKSQEEAQEMLDSAHDPYFDDFDQAGMINKTDKHESVDLDDYYYESEDESDRKDTGKDKAIRRGWLGLW